MTSRLLKFRQPIFDSKGLFQEWHYWGAGIKQGSELANVGWLTLKVDITDPRTSLQFIGKYDINRREIYEGDIDEDGGTVIWNTDTCQFVIDYPEMEMQELEYTEDWCKIVGHILKA